jgi:serine/threonine protein kinase
MFTASFQPGMLVGDRFRVEAILGQGGQGPVYLATDMAHTRQVAIKFIYFDNQESDALKRATAEYNALLKLDHPNIVRVYDAGRMGENCCYIAMEFLKGQTLAARIGAQANNIPFPEMLHILRDVALGLEAAHASSVIHRDLKPANTMLTPIEQLGGNPVGDNPADHSPSRAVLLDFGLARDMVRGITVTQVNFTAGTPEYMSPEQHHRKRKLDTRTDIYSFGILAFEMATGKPPFSKPGHQAVAIQHLTEPMPRMSDFGSDVPKWYQRLVEFCTQKKPEDRIQSMDEIICLLEGRMKTIGCLPEGNRLKPSFFQSLAERLVGREAA